MRLFSLQKGDGAEQLKRWGRELEIVDLVDELDRTNGAFMDTAAVMKNLDLVIAPETAAAHLAGALGVPVWVALAAAPDWRWFLSRSESPWYPTARLFRQHDPGAWEQPFGEMVRQLAMRAEPAAVAG